MGKLCVESLLEHRYLTKLTFSPEGSHGVFLLSKCNKRRNDYDSDLWVYDTGDEKARALTIGEGVEEFMFLSEDTLLYPKKQAAPGEDNREISKYYTLNVVTGENKEHFRTHKRIFLHEKVTESIFIASAPDGQGQENPDIIEEVPFWNQEKGFHGGVRRSLYLYLIKEDRLVPISPAAFDVKGFVYDNQRRRLYYFGSHYEVLEPFGSEVRFYDYTKKQDVKLLEGERYWIDEMVLTSEGLVFLGMDKRKQENARLHFVLKLSDKSVRPLLAPGFAGVSGIDVSTDCRQRKGRCLAGKGEHLYFSATQDGKTELYYCRLEKGGQPEPEKVTSLSGSVEDFTMKHHTVLIAAMEPMKLPELYCLQKDVSRQVSFINTRIYEEGCLETPENFSFVNFGGVKIQGWVMKPAGFEPEKQYPAVFISHNGYWQPYGELLSHQVQVLAQNGYFVMYCNPRIREDGQTLAEQGGRQAEIDFEDAMAFITAAAERYREIDEARLGIMGQGYGAFLANWTITQTGRFKAAVTEDGTANQMMDCSLWTEKAGQREYSFLSEPFGKAERLWYQSPIRYAGQVKTPVLFLQGEKAAPWKLANTAQFFTALSMQRLATRLCILKGDGEDIARQGTPQNRIKRMQEILRWFESHLQ